MSNPESSMTPITGDTYLVRKELAALGGKWNATKRCWYVPNEKADEARKLVAGAAGFRSCARCGVRTYNPFYCDTCKRFRR